MDLQDLTVQHTADFSSYLEDSVASPLGLRLDPVSIDARTMVAEGDALRRKGIIQGLLDLGYLPERYTSEPSDPFSELEMEAALEFWKKDTLNAPAVYRFRHRESDAYVAIEESDLIDPLPVLIIQTGFDEDLILKAMPEAEGPASLLSRILLFRLKTLNRYDDEIGLPLTRESLETFFRLRSHFSRSENEMDLSLLNRLGSGFQMSEVFCPRYRNQLFVALDETLSGETESGKRFAEFYKLGRKIRPTSSFKTGNRLRKFGGNSQARSTVLEYHSKKKSGPSLQEAFASDVNSLGLELLQLRLWQHGYYRGAIDADWGPVSQHALDDFLKTFHGEYELNRREFIAEVQGGFVLNLAFILEDLMKIADDTVGDIRKDDIDQITDRLFPLPGEQANTKKAWESFRLQAEALKDRESESAELKIVETFRHGLSRKNKRRRRLNFSFFGIKSAITGWFRRIKKTAGTVMEHIKRTALQIRDAIKDGLESISTFFRHALDKIKRVVRVAKTALRRFYFWISGKPFGTGDPESQHFFLTRWSIDFDTVNCVSVDCPASLVIHHLERIRFMNASLHFMVSLALEVLSILVKAATGNWLRLAWSLYTGLRKWKSWKVDNPYINYTEGAYAT